MKFDFLLFGLLHQCTMDCKDKSMARSMLKPGWRWLVWIREVPTRESNKRFQRRFNRWEPVASKNIALNADRIVKRHARSAKDAKPAVAVNREQPTLQIRRWYHRFTQPRAVWYRVRHTTAEGTPSFKKVYINREDAQQPREWSRAATDALRRDDDFIDTASTPPSREEIEKHYREIGDLCKDYLINANNFPLAEKDDSE